MKRYVFIFVLFAILLTACGTQSTPVPALTPTAVLLPVIELDVEHMVNPTLAYEIASGEGFVLNATGYDFGIAGGPTTIQIIVDGHEYTGAWTSSDKVQTVLAKSLLPPAGFKPLTVFPSDKQLIVAVGRISDKGRFEPLWVGVINVQ